MVELAPWDYLWLPFNDEFPFPDLFNLTWVFALIGIIAVSVLYTVRTRQLRRHRDYLDLYEWILWTSLIFFFLLLVYAVFHFDFVFVLVTVPIFLGILVWIRFREVPAGPCPLPAAARSRPLLLEAEVRAPGVDDPAEARQASPPVTPWRSVASASDTGGRTGPPGTVGVRGQPIFADGRGAISELAFARNARVESHANPNTTWFIVIEGGGWVQVGDERRGSRRARPSAGRRR